MWKPLSDYFMVLELWLWQKRKHYDCHIFRKMRYSSRCISRNYLILSLQQYPLSSSINVNFPLVFFIYFPAKATKRAYVFDQATNTKRVEELFLLNWNGYQTYTRVIIYVAAIWRFLLFYYTELHLLHYFELILTR